MEQDIIKNSASFYFIGIGGVSMSALAKYMLALGKIVGGSDTSYSDSAMELERLGVRIGLEDLSAYDVVVYTDAVSMDNKQLEIAKKINKKIYSRGAFLSEVCKSFKTVTAISGCHGKTTCTAMLSNIYFVAGKRFMAHIGGTDINLSNFYYSGNDNFITEACEYKRNFLLLKPDIAVVLNTDCDHMECYKDCDELKACYKQFAAAAKKSVRLYDVADVDGALTFGFDERADFFAKNIICGKGGTTFDAVIQGKNYGNIKLKTYGTHNVLNALAAMAAAMADGIDFADINSGLDKFEGVRRRMERIGYYNNVLCVADYAHHPNEIIATYKTVKKLADGEIYVIFQPHTYSRTKKLFTRFVNALSGIRHLFIYKTFAAREEYDSSGSAYALSCAVKNSTYGENPKDIEEFLKTAKEKDVILFLGAGDIYSIAKDIIGK